MQEDAAAMLSSEVCTTLSPPKRRPAHSPFQDLMLVIIHTKTIGLMESSPQVCTLFTFMETSAKACWHVRDQIPVLKNGGEFRRA